MHQPSEFLTRKFQIHSLTHAFVSASMSIRLLAIRTNYLHHSAPGGYEILPYLKPEATIGIDETDSASYNRWTWRYKFLYEWQARRIVTEADLNLVHILYAEEYFRFSPWLLPHTPIVATFHQPGSLLKEEIVSGGRQGRIAQLTHHLSKSRFRRLAAAIVITDDQRAELAKVIPEDRIHLVPLGTNVKELSDIYHTWGTQSRQKDKILTVGNWLRDWEFYFDFVAYCHEHHPEWRFTLINRKLDTQWRIVAEAHSNLIFIPEVSDDDMYQHYCTASAQFLPFIDAAGNNSVNESLAMGCPLVSNIFHIQLPYAEYWLRQFPTGDMAAAAASCQHFLSCSTPKSIQISQFARQAIEAIDWSQVALQTQQVYEKAIRTVTR